MSVSITFQNEQDARRKNGKQPKEGTGQILTFLGIYGSVGIIKASGF